MSLYAPAPASTPGRCACCRTPYGIGRPIAYDTTVKAWVLAEHISAGARR
ncbi:hypothetical protein SAMN04515671_2943 [Nakamurella panacisegetis]|uniref:Uncharacterized protein n=1 Tax=Nakamurella panacisegetis TaxID=1090615 RepID=A0A1H0PYX7_9ACTN|nr:hypothetical protein [Nakamurella panacisegetis]SDP10387.1 hypothetical protein SAMN04515671_2943 [Nakamurella panacisegetis]